MAAGTSSDLNLATAFLDSNLTHGRGGRTALVGPAGTATYAELAARGSQRGHPDAEGRGAGVPDEVAAIAARPVSHVPNRTSQARRLAGELVPPVFS